MYEDYSSVLVEVRIDFVQSLYTVDYIRVYCKSYEHPNQWTIIANNVCIICLNKKNCFFWNF